MWGGGDWGTDPLSSLDHWGESGVSDEGGGGVITTRVTAGAWYLNPPPPPDVDLIVI